MSKEEVVEEVIEEVKEEVKKEEEEVVEEEKSDIDIPENLQKYRSQINDLAKQYKNLAKECINGFDHSDFVLLVNSLTETIAKLRGVIDDLKEVDADDRVTIYNLLISAIIIKSVEESDLDENTKQQVVDAFKTGGMVLNLIELIRESIKKSLQKMDTNKDNYVDKFEFQKYHEDKFNKDCGCFGEEHNKKEAERFTNCCFPLLACGKKKIKITK